ncbi:MAG: tRNA lysidine(34) synthetase TilS [Clostridia bacterium]|nr:tRNA lysidine(34) synthetase TilS [Clostridia bacterium]
MLGRKKRYFLSLPGGCVLRCENGKIEIFRQKQEVFDFGIQKQVFGDNKLKDGSVLTFSLKKIRKNDDCFHITVTLYPSKDAILKESLYVRSRKEGDTLYYGGMTHKVKKLFSDAGIPPSERPYVPVVCDEKGILWIPGFPPRAADEEAINQQPVYGCYQVSDGKPVFRKKTANRKNE